MSRGEEIGRVTLEDAALVAGRIFPTTGDLSRVVDLSLRPFSNEVLGYLGVHEQLTIVVAQSEGTKTLSFFVKSVRKAANALEKLLFLEESKFFGEVMLELEHSSSYAPTCYLVKESLIVLDDLRLQGFNVIDAKTLDLRHLESAFSSLARFHAASMLLEERQGKPLNETYPGFFKEKTFMNDNGHGWQWLLAGIAALEAVAKSLNKNPALIRQAYDLAIEKIKPVTGDPGNVLCHSDLWINNMMFSDDGKSVRCKLVDFQMVAYTSHAVDLVQLIYLNATHRLRVDRERQLLQLYHSVLSEALSKSGRVKLQEVFRAVKDRRICGLVAAAQFLPLAFLSKEMSRAYSDGGDELQYVSRTKFVEDAIKVDPVYREKIIDVVTELIEYMENYKKFICA